MGKIGNELLERIYYGEINFSEFFDVRRNEPFLSEKKKFKEVKAQFHDKLPDDLKREFEEFIDLAVQEHAMEHATMFGEGMKLGAKLMLELLMD